MLDAALDIALAHLAVALIPGHSFALVAAGIAASGVMGGVRVMAGVTVAKLTWAAVALGLLPFVLAAGPELLHVLRIGGGMVLAGIGLTRLVRAARCAAPSGGAVGTVRGGFAASLVSPTTSVFFLSAFPATAAPLPLAEPRATALLLCAVATTTVIVLLPWFGLGLAARRIGARKLRIASGLLMAAAGTALAVSGF